MSHFDPQPGNCIGHFKILERLGQGGMGTVYKAVDLRLDRQVALKFISPQLTEDADAVRRFRREARLASQLLHPNIAAIFEFDATEARHFIAMEYVEGATVRQKMAGKPLLPADLYRLAVGSASGLAAAHQKGILHRDIKPGNVVFSEEGTVKILDFGLAKSLDPQPAPQEVAEDQATEPATVAGQLMGTYGYMPPEVLQGKPCQPASDVFSLGVLLYEAATGINPFSGATPALVISALLNQSPAPPSRLNPALNFRWDATLLKCLEKDPERRFTNAGELLTQLQSLHGLTLPGKVPTKPASRADFMSSRWHWAAMAAILLGVLLLGLWLPRRTQAPVKPDAGMPVAVPARGSAKLVLLPFKSFEPATPEKKELIQDLSDGIYERLTPIASLRMVPPGAVASYAAGTLEVSRLRADLGIDAALTGLLTPQGSGSKVVITLMDCLSGRPMWAGEFVLLPAMSINQASRDMARSVLKVLGVPVQKAEEALLDRFPTADAEAYRYYRAGRNLHSLYSKESTEQAIKKYRAALDRDPRYAEAHAGIAEAWFTMAAFGWMAPEQAYRQAEGSAKEAIKINPRVSDAHRMLANLYSMREGRLDLAEEHYQQAIEYDPSNVMALSWLAMEYAYQGRFKEALTAIGKAQELDRYSPLVTFYYGGIKYLSGDYVEGETHAEKVVVDMKAPLALAYLLLGASHLCGNKVPEARQALEEGLRRPNSPTWALAYARMEGLLAVCDLRENRPAAYRQELAAMQSKYARDHMYAYPLGVACAQGGDTSAALGWLHKAVEKRSFGWQEIRFDPFLEQLRAEPGFQNLLRQLPIRPKETSDHK